MPNPISNDELILAEAIRMVKEGVCVTFPVNGRSMLPFIIGGRESVILKKVSSIAVGDIVLAYVEGCRYVIHRVEKIDGESVKVMGDGNLVYGEHCKLGDVIARVTHVVDAKGKRHDVDAPWRKKAALLWVKLRPIRKWLLRFYKLYYKIFYRM